MATPIAIAIAVVEHEDHFLVGQRPTGVALAGYWEFPGGKIEQGETPLQAAARECLEETGLVVEPLFEYSLNVERYEHGTVELHFIQCRSLQATDPPKRPYLWVRRDALAKFEFPSGNRAMLAELLRSKGE